MVTSTEPILELRGVNKSFGVVHVLHDIDFQVYPGEVTALVGDNGAGKSTLIRCLSAAELADSGTIRLHGAAVRFRTAREARMAGINAVFQSVDADAAIDIATNLYRDREQAHPGPLGKALLWMESKGMRRSAAASASTVILLDEPTAALGLRESAKVRHFIEHLRGRGLPIVVVSHSIPQVLEVADRVHVQRLGARVAVVEPGTVDAADLLAIMSGAMHVDPKDQALGPVR